MALSTALFLVVAQVVAFAIIRRSSSDDESRADGKDTVELAFKPASNPAPLAATAVDAAAAVKPWVPPDTTRVTKIDPEQAPPVPNVKPEQAPAPAAANTEQTPPVAAVKVEQPSRAVILQRQREYRDRERKQREEQQREEQRREEQKRIETERRRAELEREKAEQARLAMDLEKQRLAAERAKAEAEAAKLAAERVRQAESPKAIQKPAGSPNVLVLVLGPGVPSVGSEQIRNVYLGRTSVWPNGTSARPMNRSLGTSVARRFFGGVLGMSADSFIERWSEIQLSGGGIAPPTINSATTLVAKVAVTQGGFGYVLESELPEDTSGVRLVRLH